MCKATPPPTYTYSVDTLREIGRGTNCPVNRDVRKKLFSLRIWSPRYKYREQDALPPPRESSMVDTADGNKEDQQPNPDSSIKLGVVNCLSLRSRLDYLLDHTTEHDIGIMALTETWLSNDLSRNKSVVDECASHGYSLHHSPRDNGHRGGGVGVLISDRMNSTIRHIPGSAKIASFEYMELVIAIGSVSLRLVVIYRMPPSKVNKLKKGTFCIEFSDYLEKLSCASGVVVIVGDFNINYLDKSDPECKQFINVLNTFNFIQNIELPTHSSGHLLDYVICRRDCTSVSQFIVSDFISDHRALHVSLACMRPHPPRKLIQVRALRRINSDALETDLTDLHMDSNCTDVDVVVAQYDDKLSSILDKHAPLKCIYVVDRELNVWINDGILALKIVRRKSESVWRKTQLTVHLEIYKDNCLAVKKAISESKANIIKNKITESKGDQKKLFEIVDTLLGRKKIMKLPKYDCPVTLASKMNSFFVDKIENIRAEFPLLEIDLPPFTFDNMDNILPTCTAVFEQFNSVSKDELTKIITLMNKTTCSSDPFPSKLLFSHLSCIIDSLLFIVNLCLSTSKFPSSCKSSILIPLIKKPSLDTEILKNYRPVANLSFLSKIIEKVIATQILRHITDNSILDNFQSAYKAGHSCETALLRVYNDIVTTIGKGNGAFLVLLDLSAAFDTIDHDNLFYMLERYVGIRGNALRLIKSYFSGRSQRVQIDGILSDIASIVCGVPQGSVLGPMKFCLYMLPLSSILRYHNIGYHIYADDTQLYVSFKCKDPKASIEILNKCISDIRVWMIKNKLKINDSKTEFIIFRSPQQKLDLSDVSVSVGDIQIPSSSRVRDLGVVFDDCLNFNDHVSNICRTTHLHLRNIGRIRKLLTFDAAAQLIHALITTRLDSCNSILYNLPACTINRLQKIQNQAARILTLSARRNHITPVLQDLHWLRVNDRIIFKILILTHKAVNCVAPSYLCDLIEFNSINKTARTRQACDALLLKIPPMSKLCSDTYLCRSFSYAAPHLWNDLDFEIRSLPFGQFKSKVKTLLYLKYFDA